MPKKQLSFAEKLQKGIDKHNKRAQKNMELFLAEQKRQGKKAGDPIDLMAMMMKKVEYNEKLYNDFAHADAYDFIYKILLPKEYDRIIDFMNKNPTIKFEKEVVFQYGYKTNLSNFDYADFFLN